MKYLSNLLFVLITFVVLVVAIVVWQFNSDPIYAKSDELGDWDKGVAYNDPNAHRLHREGLIIMEEGDYKRAEKHFEGMVQSYPDYLGGHLLLGISQAYLNNFDSARESFMNGIEIAPNNAQPYSRVGNIEMHYQNYHKAIKFYEQALALEKNYGKAHYEIGFCYYKISEYELAKKHLSKTIKLIPDSKSGKLSKKLLAKIN